MTGTARGATPGKLLELFIPTPLLTINAERRMHHMTRARYVSEVIEVTQQVCLASGAHQTKISVPVVAVFQPIQKKSGVLADAANHLPTCKAILDAIVRLGVLEDDSPAFVVEQAFLAPRFGATPGCHIRLEGQPII